VHDVAAPPLPLADGAADVVWAPRCFAAGGREWADRLAEAHRLLRPGGLLCALHAGPGVWSWESSTPWDEEGTGLLMLGLDRPEERGGPSVFLSAWWLREHWGRGFDELLLRPAGVAMNRPGQGYGLSVWRRREGLPLAAAELAALTPGDAREGRAFQRQLVLAHDEQRAAAARQARLLEEMAARRETLERPGALDEHPRVRAEIR
jgi:SAM-dependent methyltransferase